MINKKKVLAIIPARGGSKRLPRKNIIDLGGKPLIGWTIDAAIQCEYIDRVIVSTEDDEIMKISAQYGKDLPFSRSSALAKDHVTTYDVVIDIVERLREKNEIYDYIVLLQPTSPFRNVNHLRGAFDQILMNRHISSIVSVCTTEHHPLWCNTLPDDNFMGEFMPREIHNIRSQDLPKYFRLNGAIYICETSLLITEKTFLPKKGCYAFIMPQSVSIDIDTETDLNIARLYMDPFIIENSNFFMHFYNEYRQNVNEEINLKSFKKYLLGLVNEK
tara:strand:- start:154 stop:975 length:822 start_codon:yes stop_codon:yes gene_type:complete